MFDLYQVVQSPGRTSSYAFSFAAIVFLMFVPLCLAGEALDVAQRRVAALAYRGPWLDEPRALQRLRLGVMTLSGRGRGAKLYARGVGRLDHRFCLAALKAWIKFLHVLLCVPRGDS